MGRLAVGRAGVARQRGAAGGGHGPRRSHPEAAAKPAQPRDRRPPPGAVPAGAVGSAGGGARTSPGGTARPVSLDLGRVLGRAFSICWRQRWLWLLGVFGGGESFGLFFVGFPNGGATRRPRSGVSAVVITPDQLAGWLHDWAW